MLISLKIENVAVIEKAEILFSGGLNILTGETGAGKSIVIDAINAVLGERTSREIIRNGADKAKVTAYFEDVSETVKEKLAEFDVDCEDDGSLLISRIITADGRNNCKINGHIVTVSMLKSIGRDLITICGQHDSQYLLLKERHMGFIDSLADCGEFLDSYLEVFGQIKTVRRKLKKLLSADVDKERRMEFLKFQIDELTTANITPGEKEKLLEQKKIIRNREKILSALNLSDKILHGIDDVPGIITELYDLADALGELSEFDSKFRSLSETVNDFKYILEDCSSEVSASLTDLSENEVDINSVEERLDALYRLSKKYGETEEEMLSYLENISEEYEGIAMSDELIEKLQSEYDELSEELFKRGCYLSDCRKQTAITFENDVTSELKYLDMPGAIFTVDFRDAPATQTGIDDAEFLFTANAGQEPKPLAKIASGGELSRVMLAIRCVLSDSDEIPSLIFDEIDTGVSGRAAHKIARKLHELSRTKQILCVTHLAQIAACADNHLYIEKISEQGSTYTQVTTLSDEARVTEIARIIGGDVITQTTLNSARELIDFAKEDRNL